MTWLRRATADRLASEELRDVLEDLVDTAEAARLPSQAFLISGKTPQRAADELLEQGAVVAPPVPIKRLAKGCGVLVLEKPLPDALSGLVFEIDDHGIIGVNSKHHPHRRRFTIAHELGHYLLAHHDSIHIDIEAGHVPTYDWASERAANEFAAQLLMPAAMVTEEARRLRTTARLAKRFCVSQEAMGFRLANLGLR